MDRPSAADILRGLQVHGTLSVNELAEYCEAHPVAVERRCYELQRSGDVRFAPGGGGLVLTDQGTERAPDSASEA
jgi:Mn-dependent DtxR family transcriptional regulator